MLNSILLFSNLFRSEKINPERLYNFGVVVLQALILANDQKQFDVVIAALTEALAALRLEMSGIDTGISDQKTETQTVDEFIVLFYTYMSEEEPFIARQLGGRKSAGYQMIYPFGLTEYSKATKTTMPTLTDRLDAAAKKYNSKLDPAIAEKLASFKPDFDKQYGTQQQQIQAVKKDRTQKKTAFGSLQIVLTSAVFAVGLQYPGNVEKCAAFFPFEMLYPKRKRMRYKIAGTVEKNEEKELMNYFLNPTADLVFANRSNNAVYAVWLAASLTEPMPADAVLASPVPDVTINAKKLGDIKHKPLLMIKNMSDLNACEYEITLIGLRKDRSNTPLPKQLTVIEDDAEEAV